MRRRLIVAVTALTLLALAEVPAASSGPMPYASSPVLVVRPIIFPVEGSVRYSEDFGAPRSGGRSHEGNDLMGRKLQRLVSTVNGTVTYMRSDSSGNSGNMLTIKDAEGWSYVYIHVNNDSPGTDDGANPPEWRFAPGLVVGSRVTAGQFVGYMGDSGNAEGSSPHLHFEIRMPDGLAVTPNPSLKAATPALRLYGRARYRQRRKLTARRR